MDQRRRTFLKLLGALGIYSVWPANPAGAEDKAAAKIIYINPGHGGGDEGAVHTNAKGVVDLTEARANLGISLKLAEILRAKGYTVLLSREDAGVKEDAPEDTNGDGRLTNRDGLQRVVDEANDSKADLFISVHNNAATAKSAHGTEVYYCASRTFGAKSKRLARLALAHILEELKSAGYESFNRGVKDDSSLYRNRGHLFVLGPSTGTSSFRRIVHPRETKMPGILGETLFVSNETESALLKRDDIRAAIARGYAAAVDEYFQGA